MIQNSKIAVKRHLYIYVNLDSLHSSKGFQFNNKQILTGVEDNIDYISPRGPKYCPPRSGGQYIRPKGDNISNVLL